MSEKRGELECAACGKFAEGNASIHRDGFGEGPEVELCDECGMSELPTCETIWAMIRDRSGPCECGSEDVEEYTGAPGPMCKDCHRQWCLDQRENPGW